MPQIITPFKYESGPLLLNIGISGLGIIMYLVFGFSQGTLGIFIFLLFTSLWALNDIKHKRLLLKLAEKLDVKTEQ